VDPRSTLFPKFYQDAIRPRYFASSKNSCWQTLSLPGSRYEMVGMCGRMAEGKPNGSDGGPNGKSRDIKRMGVKNDNAIYRLFD
jgi:hypothetical protein